MQMSLPFTEIPPQSPEIWAHLDEVQRAVVLDKLAQLMARTALAEAKPEDPSHE